MGKKHLIIIGILIASVALIIFFKQKYRIWEHTAHYYSRLNHDAIEVLKEIQSLQESYHNTHKTYAKSIQELISYSPSVSQKLKNYPKAYQNLDRMKTFTGSAYFYSIEQSDSSQFLAQAKAMIFVEYGEDIWQISKQGEPFALKTSKLNKEQR